MEMFSLASQVAVVTGGSRGIGEVIARAFAKAGATIIAMARDAEKLSKICEEIRSAGGRAEPAVLDVTDDTAVIDAVSTIAARHGSIDILVNNAGVMPIQPLLKASLKAWDQAFQINLRATFLMSREVARHMIQARRGRIINISSFAGQVGRDRAQAYSASKAGLEGLTRSLACELGPHGITVNAIAPGFFRTDMMGPARDNPGLLAPYLKLTALGRPAELEEIVGPALMLASQAGSFITGATIPVDGGFSNVTRLPE